MVGCGFAAASIAHSFWPGQCTSKLGVNWLSQACSVFLHACLPFFQSCWKPRLAPGFISWQGCPIAVPIRCGLERSFIWSFFSNCSHFVLFYVVFGRIEVLAWEGAFNFLGPTSVECIAVNTQRKYLHRASNSHQCCLLTAQICLQRC